MQELNIPQKITFIYTDIGRGHPFYLDGIKEALIREKSLGLVRGQSSVFELSRGLSLMAWKLVRKTYRLGASDGLMGGVYSRLRHGADYNKPSRTLDILGSAIHRECRKLEGPIVVAHPILVAVLKDRPGLIYQHGELAAPKEAVVKGAEYVFVPTEQAAEPFLSSGYSRDQVFVTGLCIEAGLVRQAEGVYASRLRRINGQEPLTGAFFSSGAEPRTHVEKLVNAAGHAIASSGRVIIFAFRNGLFQKRLVEALERWQTDFAVIDSSDYIPSDLPSALVVTYSNRRELDVFTDRLFGLFDYFVAPSHERTNWALGLGLPMFVVEPAYGPFAPINASILYESEVARSVDERGDSGFGKLLKDLRQHGYLSEMSENGWKKHCINGFRSAAKFFINYCGQKTL
ncbi:MAG: hypothetical protein JSV52_08265 [Candidatus Zixiibacteriota bacterium]|nr:MAG: hypothetical protein JSV52_08265 [candidate division Zixibacteria bacterium]